MFVKGKRTKTEGHSKGLRKKKGTNSRQGKGNYEGIKSEVKCCLAKREE